MVGTRHCLYPGCKNDTRHNYKTHMQGVFFVRFPKPQTEYDKCVLWLTLCGKSDPSKVKNHWYVCSKHFVGCNGPTKDHPHPLPCSSTNEDVNTFAQDLGWSCRSTNDVTMFSKIVDCKLAFHVEINPHGEVTIVILGKRIKHDHIIWENVPKVAKGNDEIKGLLGKISQFSVCLGNPEKIFLETFKQAISKTAFLCSRGSLQCIRSLNCSLVKPIGVRSKRCLACCSYRKYLKYTERKLKEINHKSKTNKVVKTTIRERCVVKKAPFIVNSNLNQGTLEQDFIQQGAVNGSHSNPAVQKYMHISKRLSYVKPIIKKYRNLRYHAYRHRTKT